MNEYKERMVNKNASREIRDKIARCNYQDEINKTNQLYNVCLRGLV